MTSGDDPRESQPCTGEVSSTLLKDPVEGLVALADAWILALKSQPDIKVRRTLFMNLKRLNLTRGDDLPAPARGRVLEALKANAPDQARRGLLHRIAEHIRVDYPSRYFSSDTEALRWKAVVEKYPDLEGLDNTKLGLAAYTFREEQLREYHCDHTTEMANARCFPLIPAYAESAKIPEDLPALHFEKECVICREYKKGINLCPECWQKIRRCLEAKTRPHTEGSEARSV